MKVVRTATAVAVGAALVLAGTSGAATKPVCNLVTDATGDAAADPATGSQQVGPSDDAYDITSLDVASNATQVTGVVRVKKLAQTSSNSPTGIHWTVGFTIGATEFLMSANQESVGVSGAELDYISDPKTGTYAKIAAATVVYDTTANEVRITAKASDFTEKVKSGTVFSAINGTAGRVYGVKDVTGLSDGDFATAQDATDAASGDATYKAGALSCVKPGK